MADDERRWDGSTEDPGDRPSAKKVATVALGAALVVFVLQNTRSTPVTLLVMEVSYPLWMVLAATIVMSAGLGYLIRGRGRGRRK